MNAEIFKNSKPIAPYGGFEGIPLWFRDATSIDVIHEFIATQFDALLDRVPQNI